MLIIYDDQYTQTPVEMSSIHIGVKKMMIMPVISNNEACIIMGDDKGIFSKPIFIGTEKNSGLYTTIEFSDQPYGYPDLSTLFWTGYGLILIETDTNYVSADNYFEVE